MVNSCDQASRIVRFPFMVQQDEAAYKGGGDSPNVGSACPMRVINIE